MDTTKSNRADLPLADYIRLQTNDTDEFYTVLANQMWEHEWKVLGDRKDFNGRVAMVSLERAALHSNFYNTEVYVNPGASENFFVINAPSCDPTISYETDNEKIRISQNQGLVISPTVPFRVWQSGDDSDMPLTIQRSAMEAHLEALTGRSVRSPIEFKVSLSTDKAVGATIKFITAQLARYLEQNPKLLDSQLALVNIEETLMNLLLFGQAHNYSELLESRIKSPGSTIVLHAEEYLQQHADEPLTMAQLAQHLDINIRALNRAFERYRHYSPLQFLRHLRLQKAHELLRLAEPGQSVTAIALQCGFTHMSRFARDYVKQFGEYPRHTLTH